MADSFKPGDVVRLKSGGPAMTITGKAPRTGGWVVVWFSGDKTQTDAFPNDLLEPASGSGASGFVRFAPIVRT